MPSRVLTTKRLAPSRRPISRTCSDRVTPSELPIRRIFTGSAMTLPPSNQLPLKIIQPYNFTNVKLPPIAAQPTLALNWRRDSRHFYRTDRLPRSSHGHAQSGPQRPDGLTALPRHHDVRGGDRREERKS